MKSVAVCKMKSLKPFTFNFTWPQLDSFGIFVKRACIVQLQCTFECTQLNYIKIKYLVFFFHFRAMYVCAHHCAIQCLFIRFALLTIIIALIIKQALFFDHSININLRILCTPPACPPNQHSVAMQWCNHIKTRNKYSPNLINWIYNKWHAFVAICLLFLYYHTNNLNDRWTPFLCIMNVTELQ